jgi:hypothetical protein
VQVFCADCCTMGQCTLKVYAALTVRVCVTCNKLPSDTAGGKRGRAVNGSPGTIVSPLSSVSAGTSKTPDRSHVTTVSLLTLPASVVTHALGYLSVAEVSIAQVCVHLRTMLSDGSNDLVVGLWQALASHDARMLTSAYVLKLLCTASFARAHPRHCC